MIPTVLLRLRATSLLRENIWSPSVLFLVAAWLYKALDGTLGPFLNPVDQKVGGDGGK